MLALNAVAYVNTGSYVSPTWVAQTYIKDLKVPIGAYDKHESSIRGSGGTKTNEPTLADYTLAGTGLWLPGDTQFANALTRHTGRTPIEYAFADQPIANSGCKYLRVNCSSFKFERGENLGENITLDFEISASLFTAAGAVANAPTLNTT